MSLVPTDGGVRAGAAEGVDPAPGTWPSEGPPRGESPPGGVSPPGVTELRSLLPALAAMDPGVGNAERIDQLEALERLKSACAAQQARITTALWHSRKEWDATFGVPSDRQGSGVGSEVALARRDSPHRGNRHLGLARALVEEMPHTLAALSSGEIGEFKAQIMVKATATLSVEHRRRVDAELAARMGELGCRALEAAARAWAQRLDRDALVKRSAHAAKDRTVSVRPAPDTMSYLTGLLPVKQGVACFAALSRHADSVKSAGDDRSRGQIMADTLFERVTGAATVDEVGVEVQLVMTDRTLLAGGNEPARVPGYGPVPADVARDLLSSSSRAWLRRLYTSPDGSTLVQMDSRRRLFKDGLRAFLVARDQVCRTPWCDAPLRHADHVVAHAAGGPTSAENGQGECARCNQVKEQPGWSACTLSEGGVRLGSGPDPGLGRDPGPHTVELTTPTGHRYTSTAPPPLEGADPPRTYRGGCQLPVPDVSWLERGLVERLDAA